MRKRRIILVDDETIVLLVLRNFFEMREYEVLALSEPVICPVYGDETFCTANAPCADILITDNRMPRMSGLDLLEAQARRGCRLTHRNKALLSGYLEEKDGDRLRALGVVCFQKPVEFADLGRWVDECEQRMDLSVRLPVRRKETRYVCSEFVRYRPGASDSVFTGLAVNRSASGICLRITEPMDREEIVRLETGIPLSSRVAQVRWIRPTEDGAFLSGLQCL